jgi:hypothetical protein
MSLLRIKLTKAHGIVGSAAHGRSWAAEFSV